MISKLMQSARESLDVIPDPELQPIQEIPFEEGDAVFAQAEQLDIAAEALIDRWTSLEALVQNITNVTAEEATPALAAVVQSQIRLLDEELPAIATESDDVTDVEAKGERWNNIKSHAGKAAATMAAAVKAVLKSIVEFMQNIYDWVFTSNRSVSKKLDEQSQKLSSAPQMVDIEYNRRMKPLTLKQDFSPASAKACLKRYAEVLAASTYAVQDTLHFTGSFKTLAFKPDALKNFSEHFVKRTEGGIHWESKGLGIEKTGAVYEGEGGMYVSMHVSSLERGTKVSAEPVAGSMDVVSAGFSRSDMVEINKHARTLMKGVAACEPDIKKVQRSLRTMMGMDFMLSFGGMQMNIQGQTTVKLVVAMRSFLNFATKYGVATSLKASHAVTVLGDNYLNGTATKNDDEPMDDSNLVRPQLGYAG